MEMPRIMLLQILAACPAPAPPQCTIFLPMFSSTGLAAANALSSPPHMKVSVAPLAPPVPPDTGASTESDAVLGGQRMRLLGAFDVDGRAIDDQRALGHRRDHFVPDRQHMLARGQHGDDDVGALDGSRPSSRRWRRRRPWPDRARLPTRSNAVTLWPALTRLAAIGPPMLPRPMNAIFAISNSSA